MNAATLMLWIAFLPPCDAQSAQLDQASAEQLEAIPDLHSYRVVSVNRIVDGDTIDLSIDLGFRLQLNDRFRLHGINAPEVRGASRKAGDAATRWLADQLKDQPLIVRSYKDQRGSFGRWLVELLIVTPDGVRNVNREMIKAGHAVEYRR